MITWLLTVWLLSSALCFTALSYLSIARGECTVSVAPRALLGGLCITVWVLVGGVLDWVLPGLWWLWFAGTVMWLTVHVVLATWRKSRGTVPVNARETWTEDRL